MIIDNFGDAVAIADQTIVVAAPWEDDRGAEAGSAYVFTRDDVASPWSQAAKLTASDGERTDYFGSAVDVSDRSIVVGARLEDGCVVDFSGCNSGAAYVFERDDATAAGWTEVAKLTAADKDQDDRFGTSVSISGATVVVGAHRNDDGASLSGSAYVFSRDLGGSSAWGQLAKLLASDATAGDEFGFAVPLCANVRETLAIPKLM